MGRSIKSAERTLALLELYSISQRPMTVGEVARSLSIPQPSATMLLRNLADLGYLEYDIGGRTYMPSVRVLTLGSWLDTRAPAQRGIVDGLSDLQACVGETAYVALQNGPGAQYVMRLRPGDPHVVNVPTNRAFSLTSVSVGQALLALKPDAEIASLVHRCNAEATDARLRVVPKGFMEVISKIRHRGYSFTEGSYNPLRGAISIAFDSFLGGTPIAVGVGGPVDFIRSRREGILDALWRFRSQVKKPA